ncbi:MAG: DMT family transporter [Rubrivivax sp.]|nr:DMT family transporter [Rubrivivax sp.]
MPLLTPRQFWVLAALTLVWGLNWPVMKAGVSGLPSAPSLFPPLTFRAASMWLGLPVLALALLVLRVPFAVPRRHWRELVLLTASNMLVWHVVIIIGVQQLSSGRSAILGYTMPVFAALWGRWIWGDRLAPQAWAGVAAAAGGVLLLLWSELSAFGGQPDAVLAIVVAAAVWAYGTHRLRRSTIDVPLLAIVFWMTALTAVVMLLAALAFERPQWRAPEPLVWGSIVYNAIGVFGFAHAAWFYLARTMPPVASSISVMLIPVLGVFSGAVLLGATVHGTDWAAVALIVLAIALVLLRRP